MIVVEEWRDIPGYEGFYQVSSKGSVRGVARRVENPTNGGYEVAGKQMSPRRDKDGYLLVCLFKKGDRETLKVHRLVALAFLPMKSEREKVDHINGVRDDNRVSNLRWVNVSENLLNRTQSAGASGEVGVRYREGKKNPWQAYTSFKGRFRSLGHFSTKELAVRARADFVKEVFYAGS